MIVNAISLYNPWAMWVMLGWKKIETRYHSRFKCLVGQTIAIHAAKKWDHEAYTAAIKTGAISYGQLHRSEEFKSLRGVILGTVYVEEFRSVLRFSDSEHALIVCHSYRTGLVISNPFLFTDPIPCKGHQGIFKVEIP